MTVGCPLWFIVTAAVEAPDVLVGHVGDHLLELWILAEEVLASVGAALGLEVLVLAVDALFHHTAQQAVGVARQQRIPARAPQHLDDVPAGAHERGLELLDDLAVAAHRTIEALQVAVDDEHEVVELLAHRQRERAHALGLVHLAVAEERPDLAIARGHEAAVLHVALEARLVDGHHRPQAHRHRRELPEVRHEPRMRIRRQAVAARLLAEVLELVLAQAALEERARIDAGRRVALDEDHVARMALRLRAPEVVEAHLVQRRRRGIRRQVAAVLARLLVRIEHHRERVPADARLDALLHLAIARIRRLLAGRDRVDVGGVRTERQVRARAARVVDELLEEIVGARGALGFQDRIDRFDPLACLDRVEVFELHDFRHTGASPRAVRAKENAGAVLACAATSLR
jgi:hypothetical protein